jgi:hypothetical protein
MMKKLSLLLLLSALIFSGCSDDDNKNEVIIGFNGQLTTPESEFTTTEGTPVDDYYQKVIFRDAQNLLAFDHYFAAWGFGGGFTYTNKTDVATAEYTNNSAITGRGMTGSVYLTANTSDFTPAVVTLLKPEQYAFKGVWVTNSTYAYRTMRDGNDYARKFEAGDWFKLTAIGYDVANRSIGQAEYDLTRSTSGGLHIAATWQWFDLSPIASAASIRFELTSSDTGDYGMNTPSYFCMDAITLTEK